MATYLASFSASLKDYLGTKVSHDLFVTINDADTLAQIATVAADYCAVLGAIIGGEGLDFQVKIHLPTTGLPVSAVAGDEAEKTGLFAFDQSNSTYVSSVDVPTIDEGKIVNGKINLADTDVAAWVSWIGTGHTNVRPVSKYSNNLNGLESAAITFRKHRRSLNRTSSEPG